ncbi:PAS domain-containing protein, partial [Streptomyces sp. NPDC057616]|uniref:PAS domain-containing protein n=1 Tax=Streptomyces sp. NPDC057616 TaxID=3346183 RepID=UPI00369043BF
MSPVNPFDFDETATARAVVDAEGTLVGWSAGAERLLGWTAADAVGRPAAEFLVGEATGPVFDPDGSRWHGLVTLRHRDGGSVPVWLLAHRTEPDGGGPAEWLVVSPLEGDRRRMADDPLEQAGLLQSPCAVAICDDRLRLRRINDVMAEVLGLPEEHVRGLRLPEVSGRPQGTDIERHLRRVLTTGQGHDVQTYVPIGLDGRPNVWLARMSPITDTAGRIRGVCVAAHDFSEQYQARERLQLVNEASVRIGTTLDVTRTAEELAEVCVPALADFVSVDLLDPQDPGGEPYAGPPTDPVVLRRTAHLSVNPGTPEAVVEIGHVDRYPTPSPQADPLLAGHSIV